MALPALYIPQCPLMHSSVRLACCHVIRALGSPRAREHTPRKRLENNSNADHRYVLHCIQGEQSRSMFAYAHRLCRPKFRPPLLSKPSPWTFRIRRISQAGRAGSKVRRGSVIFILKRCLIMFVMLGYVLLESRSPPEK